MLAVALAGCATTPEEAPTDKELYEQAHDLRRQANYEEALKKFDELTATYPASLYAQQSMVDVIHMQYARNHYAGTLDAANRFIQAFPDHASASYALYMGGLAHFREDQNLIDRVGFQDPSERSPESMRLAFFSFKQIVEQYPDSEYAEDSANRMRYLINALARNQIHIARYYLRRNAPLAAIGRAREVLNSYADSTATEDALVVLARAYQMMGAESERKKVRRLLHLNFPQNPVGFP